MSSIYLTLSVAGPHRWTWTTPHFPPHSDKGQRRPPRRCWSPGLRWAAGQAWRSALAVGGLSPTGWRAPDLSWPRMPSPGCSLDAQWPAMAGWWTWASLKGQEGCKNQQHEQNNKYLREIKCYVMFKRPWKSGRSCSSECFKPHQWTKSEQVNKDWQAKKPLKLSFLYLFAFLSYLKRDTSVYLLWFSNIWINILWQVTSCLVTKTLMIPQWANSSWHSSSYTQSG